LSPEYTARSSLRALRPRLGRERARIRRGYRLSRPAEAISVWSALEVLGGAFFSRAILRMPRRAAAQVRAIERLWIARALARGAGGAARHALGIHLADLQRDERAMAAWLDPIRLVRFPEQPSSPSSRRFPDE